MKFDFILLKDGNNIGRSKLKKKRWSAAFNDKRSSNALCSCDDKEFWKKLSWDIIWYSFERLDALIFSINIDGKSFETDKAKGVDWYNEKNAKFANQIQSII